MRPQTTPQACPVCHTFPDMGCKGPLHNPMPEVHAERLKGEHGAWTLKYDELHRDKSLKFDTRPYARRAA